MQSESLAKSDKVSRKKSHAFSSLILTFFVLFILANMIAFPAKFISRSLDGISAWAFNVLPSVLPFMFFTRILSTLGTLSKFTRPLAPLSNKLFKTPPISIYTFCMAVLSGYPVGSKMVADLFLQGQISKEDAFKMSSFCSTSGPMFIIGAVGIGMFHSSKVGYILFLSHMFGAILNGLLYRNLKIKTEETENILNESTKQIQADNSQKSNFNLADIVTSSTLAILSVGCIIAISFIVIECFSPLLSLLPQNIAFFVEGLLEITKGCIDLSTLSNLNASIILTSFVISFGGISTLLQSLTMLSSIKMPVKLFTLQKFTHACLSTLITIVILLIV